MKRIISSIIIACAVCSLQAQEVFDLQRCLEIGLQQNYSIRIVRNEQQISDNNATVGNAGYLPTLDLNAGYSGTINDTEQTLAAGGKNKLDEIHNRGGNAGLNLNWTLFDGFRIQANYAKLKELQSMGEVNTRMTIENFIADLTSEYYNYVRQTLRLSNLKYAVSLSKERLRIVEVHYNIGSRSRLDYQQAQVDFNADSSNFTRQLEVVYASGIRLNQLMAADKVDQKICLRDSLIEINSALNESILWDKTMSANSELILSEKNKTLSELDYKMVKSRNYPYLKLNTGYGYSNNLYETGAYNRQEVKGFNYGLTLGFNIFDGMNRKREQKNARLQIENRNLQLQQLELGLKADLSNFWMAYQNNLDLINLEQSNLEVARNLYEAAIDRFKVGELAGIELREAQNSLLAAEERLLLAQYNTKLCEISLMQISGQVTEYLGE